MASKSEKLHRLRDVLHALETVERAKVGDLTQQIGLAEAAQSEILESMQEPTPLHGRFVGLLSRRVGSLERQLHGLTRQREAALTRYTDAMGRERAAKSLFAKSRTSDARAAEEQELEALMQFFDASSAQGRGKSKAPK